MPAKSKPTPKPCAAKKKPDNIARPFQLPKQLHSLKQSIHHTPRQWNKNIQPEHGEQPFIRRMRILRRHCNSP
jgi:hypothetical protein